MLLILLIADTWEQKVITYDGDTSGGGIDNDNGKV